MVTIRQQRVAEQIQQEISALLVKGLKDPRLEFVTITGVEVTADLRIAWVYFSSLGGREQREGCQRGLESASNFIRRSLGKRLRLKTIPEFHFKYDESLERGARIESLLEQVRSSEGWDNPQRVRGSAAEVARALEQASRVLVTCHDNPDGDALASVLAMRNLLTRLGKQVVAYCHGQLPYNFRFLPGSEEVVEQPGDQPFDATLVLDCSELERCGPLPEESSRGRLLSIDHHLADEPLGEAYYLDPTAAAVGLLIEEVAGELAADIDPELATCIYTSVLADTGSFRYSNTDPRALECAARMLARGVQPWEVAFAVYESQPASRVKLLGEVLATLTLEAGGRVATIVVTNAMLERAGATIDMLDGFINYPRGIAGVEVAVQVRETEDDCYKFSFRSAGRVDVAAVAARFGGGGHRNASGCTLRGPLDEARRRVLQAIEEELE